MEFISNAKECDNINQMRKLVIRNAGLVRLMASFVLIWAIIMTAPCLIHVIKEPIWLNIFQIGFIGLLTVIMAITILMLNHRYLLPGRNYIKDYLLMEGSAVRLALTVTVFAIDVAIALYSMQFMDTDWRAAIQRGSFSLAAITFIALDRIWSIRIEPNKKVL